MKYEDPENLEVLIKEIFKMKTVQEIIDMLSVIYPEFITARLEEYSKDYPHFDINWRGMCMTLKVKKTLILLVDYFPSDDKHILLKTFCEVLTQSGFIIRRNTEFFPCSVCNHALPNNTFFDKLKSLDIKTPEKWDTKCSTCS